MRLPVLLSLLVASGIAHAIDLNDTSATAASATLKRVFPSVASHFLFKTVKAPGHPLLYSYVAKGGTVLVEGPSAVAMCRGAYDYLRNAVGAEASWSGTSLGAIKGKLPDAKPTRVESPYKLVLQDNVCVFGYTTAFFGWRQWEHYLDVMALHGINMQFSLVGGEAIWDRVWTKLGISRADLDNFFTGPAFLPWHRMGNVNKHDGPLPASYKIESIALEKQILTRMRQLGIQPVAPAFAGFVPPGFSKAYPKETVLRVASWAGFQDDYRTRILNPLSPMYAKIGGAFIKEWRKEFGDAKYYLADSFNELQVPVSSDRAVRLEQLTGFGKAVYDGIRAGDPKGTWVMQGWLFFNAANFWDPESVAALLKPVPNDKMLILDLFAETDPTWKRQQAFFGKQWVVSNITTWGGNNQVYGNFDLYSKLSSQTLAAPNHGNLVGYGISFEGSESNEAQFELLCDSAWTSKAIDVESFLPNLVKNRYGASDPHALKAWKLFADSVYKMPTGIHPNHLLQSRPFELSPTSHGEVHDSPEFRAGVKELLLARKHLGSNPLYRADVAQFSAQMLLCEADLALRDAVLAAKDGERDIASHSEDRFELLTRNADRLLASHPLDRLSRWVNNAKAWAKTPNEQKYYERDAKRQVTVWGGPDLSEYAAKMWSGMIESYYAARWIHWMDAKRTGAKWDQSQFEENWINTPTKTSAKPLPDELASAEAFVSACAFPAPSYASTLIGIPAGNWKKGEQTTHYQVRKWDLSSKVTVPGTVYIRFQYTSGACRLDISGADLYMDGLLVASDPHYGRTGLEDSLNTFKFKLSSYHIGGKLELRARVRSDGGTDSNGTLFLRVK